MANTGRTLLSTTAVLLMILGTFSMIILIFEKTNIIEKLEYEEWYKAGAAVTNILAVLFISYLLLTSPDRSQVYKVFIVLILIAGLIAEFVFTNIFTDLAPQYATYIVIVFNFLLRVYTLIQLTQEPWDSMTLTSSSAFPSFGKTLESATPSAVEKAQDVDASVFKEQWRAIFQQARDKVGRDNFDETSREKGFKEVIQPAVSAGDFSKDRLKAAAAYLKDKGGNVISDLIFGGRKLNAKRRR